VAFTRRRFIALTGLGAATGCAGCVGAPASESEAASSATDPRSGGVPTADETLWLPASPEELESLAVSGGPPKDGIPSIDRPSFVDPEGVDFLDPGDPVFGVEREGVCKAYPQKILVHHEIVNDRLGDLPVAVTYCPLTGTVQGFERGGTTFGVSGRLINNNLVMYDRATETWWPQILATSIPGPWNGESGGESLREFRLVWTSWERWRDRHPDTRVLSTETGYAKNYGNDPYGAYNPPRGYYTNANTLFETPVTGERFHRKRVFLGARTAAGAVAFGKSALLERGTMSGEVGGTPAVAVADRGLNTGYVYLNPEERAVAFEDGTVTVDGDPHEPDDLPLGRVHAFDAMWFAWRSYYPDTDVHA
jgi:hypothetical protein